MYSMPCSLRSCGLHTTTQPNTTLEHVRVYAKHRQINKSLKLWISRRDGENTCTFFAEKSVATFTPILCQFSWPNPTIIGRACVQNYERINAIHCVVCMWTRLDSGTISTTLQTTPASVLFIRVFGTIPSSTDEEHSKGFWSTSWRHLTCDLKQTNLMFLTLYSAV